MGTFQLTIVGAGLIGGSIALAARKNGSADKIVAIDRASEPANDGQRIFDQWVQADDQDKIQDALEGSSLTILCVPVRAIIELLPTALKFSKGPVTDCGSTKRAIVEGVSDVERRSHFIPGHPMAGHPEGGLDNAQADLFEGRKWIICPGQGQPEARKLVTDFIQGLGAEVLEMSEEAHDRAVAVISHVPQVIASVLAVDAKESEALDVAGPGFASATRVAGGAEAMWKDIFATNGSAIGETLIRVSAELSRVGEQLKRDEISGALDALDRARKQRK